MREKDRACVREGERQREGQRVRGRERESMPRNLLTPFQAPSPIRIKGPGSLHTEACADSNETLLYVAMAPIAELWRAFWEKYPGLTLRKFPPETQRDQGNVEPHSMDNNPHLHSRLVQRQSTFRPFLIQFWSRYPRIFEVKKGS